MVCLAVVVVNQGATVLVVVRVIGCHQGRLVVVRLVVNQGATVVGLLVVKGLGVVLVTKESPDVVPMGI